ncbi:MAG: hypothetical protein ACLFRD_06100 [Nitriliruptoraceae bacterium]
MTATSARIARVVVEVEPLHLDRPFDYAIPDDVEVVAGQRVLVSFAGRRVRGLVVAVADATEVDPSRLRTIQRVLGEHVWVRAEELEVLRWAAARFGAPLADVVRHALPDRTVDVERRAAAAGWFPPGTGRRPSSDPPPSGDALERAWAPYGSGGGELLAAVRGGHASLLWRPLPGEDLAARIAELAQLALAGDRDVLLIVPDPASPTADAVVRAAGDLAVDLRGGPSRRRVYRGWLEARCGVARVVVGQLGAAFVPLERLGLAVVLDEANPALKARSSPHHHAREVVLERARRAGGVGLAVGTVPSAVAWRLLRERRVTPVLPDRAIERRHRPRIEVRTGQDQPRARLLRESTAALRAAVGAGAYGVVLAARRGIGAALVCADCGERWRCPRCAASLSAPPDTGRDAVRCGSCGWDAPQPPPCPGCGSRRFVPLAAGARQLAAELERTIDAEVVVLEGYGQPVPPPPAVLVMTRGSALDTPPGQVDAVVLPDIDASLRRPSLDAAEDTLRLATTLAGWAVHGRRDPASSRVVVQTRDPEHHAITALTAWDPGGFWRAEVAERAGLGFPPVNHAIRLTVPAPGAEIAAAVEAALPEGDELLGPLPAEGRDGYLIKSRDRETTLRALRPVRERLGREDREVRVDVDPVDAL